MFQKLRSSVYCAPFRQASGAGQASGGQGAAKNPRLHQAASPKRARPLDIHLQLLVAVEQWTHWPFPTGKSGDIMRHPKGRAQREGWKKGSNGAGQRQKCVVEAGFIISRKWSPPNISCHTPSTMASDGDEGDEFHGELESVLVIKSTYTAVVGDFNALDEEGKPNWGTLAGERNERMIERQQWREKISCLLQFPILEGNRTED